MEQRNTKKDTLIRLEMSTQMICTRQFSLGITGAHSRVEYYCVVQILELDDPAAKECILGYFGSAILKGAPVIVRQRDVPQDSAKFKALVRELAVLPSTRLQTDPC